MNKKMLNILLLIISLFILASCNTNGGKTNSGNTTYTSISIDTPADYYIRDGNKIFFGRYPQNKITDENLIKDLNTMAGSLPSPSLKFKWSSYDYYMEGNIASYMYYQDIDYDNDGLYDYRGVYLKAYRPLNYNNASPTTNAIQETNGYLTDIVYWFSYDKIEWDILAEAMGQAVIITNMILDSQDFYPSKSDQKFSHNGSIGYTSNYELSNIRKWLNDNFYNTAFNNFEKELINITNVDNRRDNEYACNNTQDKIYLLSLAEANTYYSNIKERQAKGSDYANSQGLFTVVKQIYSPYLGYSCWWLRSPSNQLTSLEIITDGKIIGADSSDSSRGVRPACNIKL